MDLLFMRHGQTLWNQQRRLQGHQDIPLTPAGLQDGESLSEYLKDYPIQLLFSSPLSRAYQSAELINRHHRLDIQVDSDLIERDYKACSGLLYDEYRNLPIGERSAIESDEAVYQRALNFLSRMSDSGMAAIVTHGGFLSNLLYRSEASPDKLKIEHRCIYWCTWAEHELELKAVIDLNEVSL